MLRQEKQTPLTVTMLVQEGSWWPGLDEGLEEGSGDGE